MICLPPFSFTGFPVPAAIPPVSKFMEIIPEGLNAEPIPTEFPSAGSNVPFAGEPMPCSPPFSSLIHRFRCPTRLKSSRLLKVGYPHMLSWSALLPLMRTMSPASSSVTGASGVNGSFLSPYPYYPFPFWSAAALKPSTGSSCRLEAPQIFFS